MTDPLAVTTEQASGTPATPGHAGSNGSAPAGVLPEATAYSPNGTTKAAIMTKAPGPVDAPSAPQPASGRGSVLRGRRMKPRTLLERYLLVLVWAAIALVFAVAEPDSFLQTATIHNIFGSSDVLVFLALAAMCTGMVGGIDLSVAFIAGLSATIVPLLVSQHGWNVWLAAVAALAASVLCGVLNAVVIVVLKVDALIATLGSGTVLLGVAEGISHSVPVAGVPTSFSKVGVTDFLGLPMDVWYGVILAIVMTYVFAFTPLGRAMTFVGANREVARLAGIRVQRIRFGAYIVGGLLAGIGGLALAAELGGFDSTSSGGYLLPTFAVAFLSGAVVRPGRFNPIGVLIGAYFISTGTLGLQLLGYNGWTEQVFYGGALIVAVVVVTAARRSSV